MRWIASLLASIMDSIQTDWQMSGFGPQHTGYNPSEHTVGITNVSHLVLDWTALTGDIIYSSAPAIANGVAYIGSFDGEVYAIDVATGQRRWVGVTHGLIDSSPAVVNGVVYVASDDSLLYAFNAS